MLEFQGETGLYLRCDGNLGIPFLIKQGNRPSSLVEEREKGTLLELWLETRCSSHVGTGISGKFRSCSPSCSEGTLGVPLKLAQGDPDLSRADGKLDVLFHCSRIRGVPLEIQLVRQASSCGVRGSWVSS